MVTFTFSTHVRRKVPIGYNGAPQIPSPQKYPFPLIDLQSPITWSDLPFFHNALDRQADRPTDRPRESLMTICRCAP